LNVVIHISSTAPYLPPSLRGLPRAVRYTVRLSESERKIFRKRRRIPVSRWAEQYRHVTLSVLPGKWKNDITPYGAGIMDASFFPSVQTIIICKAPQVGGTEFVLNCLGYAIDRDPGPALAIYPDEQTAKENNQDRIQPMIRKSPRLRSYMTGFDDDASMLRISLQHMPIYMAWARSASRLGNKPARYLIFDETDKYVETAGKREADPISLGESRTTTYRFNRKIWKLSTPTVESGNIWKALTTEAQVIFDYWVTCPACGVLQKMVFGQIKWVHKGKPGPDGKTHSEDPETIEAEKLAWYECPHCLFRWSDYDRDAAVRRGQWRERVVIKGESGEILRVEGGLPLTEYLKQKRPVKIGFHIPSWISPFVSLAGVAAAFLRGLTDMNKFKDFHNKHLAEPWKWTLISKESSQVLAARLNSFPAQIVPEEAIALLCGVDVQKEGFWFVVRAFDAMLTSWLIHYGFLATWGDVEKLLFETAYPIADKVGFCFTGRNMRIFRAAVDTGGGKKYEDMTMTEETYFWLLKNRGRGGVNVWGTKGSSTVLPGMLSLGPAIMSTPAGKKLPGALRILSVDTHKAKDQFHYRLALAANPDDRNLPGAAFLHKDVSADYVAQILAEQKQINEKGIEEWVNKHQRPNHLFDAEVLCAACAEMEFPGGGLRLLAEHLKRQNQRDPKTTAHSKRRVISQGVDL
jgi:phage terminase large subunit GpA-like protein